MDAKLINPFLDATVEVLTKMASVHPRQGKPFLKKSSVAYGDVSGIIGITGDATGSLAISFTEPCICNLVERMLGDPCPEANQDVFDAVGEITNMVSGAARTRMEKDGFEVYAAIPTVIYGKEHTVNHILKSPSIVIPFETDHGTFAADVCIMKVKEEEKRIENYQVQNEKTATDPGQEGGAQAPSTPSVSDAPLDRKQLLTQKLAEITAMRDSMIKELDEKPFMQVSQRQMMKKKIPVLDAKIKRLRIDISTITMLSNLTQDDLDNPKVAQHFQHYDPAKKK
ncbi:MAG: chemotaxis protein CheX [Syntrophaceae bacterium]|nr:chemotaxis protein CheX [Syntrophaceae bacterium]